MSEIKKIPVILDGDPGHDDAIAWVFAKANPVFDIKAVTSVAGNQTLSKTTYNAMRICTLLGIDAPIAKGRELPLLSPLITAEISMVNLAWMVLQYLNHACSYQNYPL